jgi:hypothetical protein
MIDGIDKWTKLIDAPLNYLTKTYPVRTGVGALGGLSTLWIAKIFDPVNAQFLGLSIANLNEYQWALVGVFVAHIKTLLDNYRNPRTVSKRFNDQLALIDMGDFSPSERRAHVRRILIAEIEKTRTSKQLQQELADSKKLGMPNSQLSNDE